MIHFSNKSYCSIGKRIQSGDISVFNSFFKEFYKPVYGRAFRILKNKQDAEEATQDVFIKLWQKKLKWNSNTGTFKGWFRRLAENTIIDAQRKISGREKRELLIYYDSNGLKDYNNQHDLLEYVPDYKSDALDNMVSDEISQLIDNALILVSKREYRLAWILRHYENYSYAEIAKITNGTVSSCKMWVFRCRNELQFLLEKKYK